MSVAGYDFSLNGVKYKAAPSEEGPHYVFLSETTRPPNAVTVQGEASQKFQVRPDLLLWSITDWSGGEGIIRYNTQQPNRHNKLYNLRAFDRPGTVKPGYATEVTKDSGGTNELAVRGLLAKGVGTNLYLLDVAAANVYTWAGTKWSAATALTGVTNGATEGACGDETAIYWQERSTAKIWKWTGGGAPSTISTTVTSSTLSQLVELGAYVYVYSPSVGRVWEVAKTGASTTLIDDWGQAARYSRGAITTADGKVYVMFTTRSGTSVREIVPTTAAGTGFGAEIARFPGFVGTSMWAHSGLLFLAGNFGLGDSTGSVILYITPGGEYGTLGTVREDGSLGEVAGSWQAGRMVDHFFATGHLTASDLESSIFQVDSVTGGFAQISDNKSLTGAAEHITSIAQHEGDIFYSNDQASTDARTYRAQRGKYSSSSHFITGIHDMDVADQKILQSMTLNCAPLPADWDIVVAYRKDDESSFTTAFTYTTDGGTGTSQTISVGGSTVKFRTLQVKVTFTYTGAGTPTTAPTLYGLDVVATIVKPVKQWQVLLDMSTPTGYTDGFSGTRRVQNLITLAESGNVVTFLDGYQSAVDGEYYTYNVVVEQVTLLLSQPGEGYASVRLREVV